MKREIAEHLVAVVNSCAARLAETLPLVEDNVPEAEFKVYKRAIAKVMNTMDMEIVTQVARQYPDLVPWERQDKSNENKD